MKKNLLVSVIFALISFGAMSQVNFLNGDCESADDWDVTILGDNVKAGISIDFGNPTDPPLYGIDNNLKIHWEGIGGFDMYIYQTVTLKVGTKYEFSGAYRDVASNPDNDYFWHQVMMQPVNGHDMVLGPNNELYGENPSFLQGMAVYDGVDNEGGLGQDVVYSGSKVYGGSFTGEYDLYCNQGDTTVFTVPSTYPTATGGLELGENGTEVDFYFILYWGQWGETAANIYDFTFDEMSIIKYGSTSVSQKVVGSNNFKAYPNPVGESLHVSNTSEISSVAIRNIVGQEVLRVNNIYHNTTVLNTSGLDKGIYAVTITDAKGAVSTKKVVKQ